MEDLKQSGYYYYSIVVANEFSVSKNEGIFEHRFYCARGNRS
jgi:hypothetical protein